MSEKPFQELAHLDKLVHEPARLSVLTALASCDSATFPFLRKLTGLTKGNLSSHLSKLETAGLVEIEKSGDGPSATTRASLSDDGRQAIARYWDRLDDLRDSARAFREQRTDLDSESPINRE